MSVGRDISMTRRKSTIAKTEETDNREKRIAGVGADLSPRDILPFARDVKHTFAHTYHFTIE